MMRNLSVFFVLLCLSVAIVRARLYGCPKCSPCIEDVASNCPDPSDQEKDFCGCCPRCLKKIGEVCGGEEGVLGKCLPFLFCDRPKQAQSKLRSLEGVCRERFPRPYNCPAIPCNLDFCRKDLVCYFGFGLDGCSCCPFCAQGLDEVCGQDSKCGKGLICVEYYDSVLDKVTDRCKPWFAPSPAITFPH